MSNVFPEKAISAVTKVITSPVDKKTMPDEIPVFLCNYTDVYYNSKITGNMPFMEATAKQSEIDRFSLFPNDVVITKDSESADDIGIPTYIQSIRENLLCGYHLTILRPKKNIDGRFLSLTLTHPRISYDFYRYANGITRFGLTTETYSKVKIPLPPVPEQKAIADLLSTWDEAIEKTERLIQAKEKRFKWLLRELISEPRNTQKNTEWKKVKLGDLFGKAIKVEKGKALTKESNTEGNIPVVAGGQTYAYHTNHPTHEIPTVTVSASGAYAGFIWYHDYPIWASDCNVLHATEGVTKFLYFTLKAIQHRVYALQSGGAQPHVYSKDMKNLHILWPSIEEQHETSETLSSAQHEIDLLKQLADKYKTQKRGLMQKMLTGIWRMPSVIIDQFSGINEGDSSNE